MKTIAIDALARAFGMLVAVIAFLWFVNGALPSNWWAVAAVYLLCVPIAGVYGWLAGAQEVTATGRPRVLGLLLIAIGAVAAIGGYALNRSQVEAIFYDKEATPKDALNTGRQPETCIGHAEHSPVRRDSGWSGWHAATTRCVARTSSRNQAQPIHSSGELALG
jgi:hypothetical protein